MRRSQRPSQRSADSKLTTHTNDSKLTNNTLDSKLTYQTQDSKLSDSGTSYSISDPERYKFTRKKLHLFAEFRFEDPLDKDQPAHKSRNAKKSANLILDQEAMKINHTGQFLETPKQSPDSEIPPPLAQNEEKDTKEVKGKVSARERWAKGKTILKGGERESQKSQHSAASGGSSGSPGPQTSAVTMPNMVQRKGLEINKHSNI